jgi:hypothetical protein
MKVIFMLLLSLSRELRDYARGATKYTFGAIDYRSKTTEKPPVITRALHDRSGKRQKERKRENLNVPNDK